MSQALCLKCGAIKMAALNACPDCKIEIVQDAEFMIRFTEHDIELETLKALGEFLRKIIRKSKNETLAFWTFIYYISEHHPGVLQIRFSDDKRALVDENLRKIGIPQIKLKRPSNWAKPVQPQEDHK